MMDEIDLSKYEKIINIPHHEPINHRRMSRNNRAAQFAPFAALNGFEETIIETGKEIVTKQDLTDSEKEIISSKIQYLLSFRDSKPIVNIVYFVKDDSSIKGGKYLSINSSIFKIDEINKIITLDNKMRLKIGDIISINSEIFEELY